MILDNVANFYGKNDHTSSSKPSLTTDPSLFSNEWDLSTNPQKAQSVMMARQSSISNKISGKTPKMPTKSPLLNIPLMIPVGSLAALHRDTITKDSSTS